MVDRVFSPGLLAVKRILITGDGIGLGRGMADIRERSQAASTAAKSQRST
jgi:hypothetical protein